MKEKTKPVSHQAKKKTKVMLLPYLLILPVFILFGAFSFYPFFKTIVSSFSITSLVGEWQSWAGFLNWERLFDSDRFWMVIGTTFKFAALNLVMTFFGAMFLALISAKKTKGLRIYSTLYALPMAIASTPAAAIWRFIYRADAGFLNSFFGTDVAWLSEKETALICVAIVTSWMHIASSYIFLLAGFRNVPDELMEAASLDGANSFVKAVRIMIPMASPQIFFVLFLNITTAFKSFGQIKLLTSGQPAGSTTTLIYEVYEKATYGGQYEAACCISLVLFLVIFITTRIQFVFEKKLVHYQ